ncbi:MAG: sugar phosphate nucleotidyltransferase [Vicinamibacterales bacterium]
MKAVILAGGKGRRLAPYTTVLPKPLMPIGDMPILEVVLRQLKRASIDEVIIAIGHLGELIRVFFGDGSRLGLPIRYVTEDTPLGTVGPLAFIENLSETFLLMNGDVLTTLDYGALVAAHRAGRATATIAIHERPVHIDYGVLEVDEANRLTNFIEKPTLKYRVSMGVYAFERSVVRHVERGRPLDFPDLVKKLLREGEPVMGYPFDGYWLDIGRPDDYARAVEEFEARRTDFLGE